ncbi:MAG: DsbA family protein [Paracoccaceae bacterium]|nr:DsbA family protein [Paracoccaceae bacterium]MDG1736785.1 DsbA family protein [Paracoccaceae bacterium]MDG2258334.1 DsbA family protein [Paracoccaceae bacterium]
MKRLLKFFTVLALLASPVHAFDIDNMTDEESSAFGDAVRNYLLENPELIIEVIQVLEQQRQVDEVQSDRDLVNAFADDLFDDGFSHIAGNPDGSVDIVEFVDYRCGYCRKAHPEVKEIIAENDEVRMVYKEYPILGEESVIASRFAIATRMLFGGESYEAMQDALMAFGGSLNEVNLRRLANALDLDDDAILAEMTSVAVSEEINANRALGNQMSITGTPTFILETEMLRGYVPKAQFVQLISELSGE